MSDLWEADALVCPNECDKTLKNGYIPALINNFRIVGGRRPRLPQRFSGFRKIFMRIAIKARERRDRQVHSGESIYTLYGD
jgi:hypothetical protein